MCACFSLHRCNLQREQNVEDLIVVHFDVCVLLSLVLLLKDVLGWFFAQRSLLFGASSKRQLVKELHHRTVEHDK